MQFEIEKLSQKETFKPKDFSLLREIFRSLLSEIDKIGPKVVIIAGTNGKGETAHNIAHIARLSSIYKNVALWTSPHVKKYNERFNFNRKDLSNEKLEKSLKAFLALYPGNSCQLSFYELSFWIFCHQAIEEKADLIVLEVGLGGRFDAVNLFDADVCVLTSISRDHTEFLGGSYKSILSEKLGVLRPSSKFIYSVRTEYLKLKIKNYCERLKIKDSVFVSPYAPENTDYQYRNKLMAYEAFKMLGARFDMRKLASIPTTLGRGNSFYWNEVRVDFFNAHNIDGHREFQAQLDLNKNQKIVLFFSKRPVKEIQQIYKMYSRRFQDRLILGGVNGHHKLLSVSLMLEHLKSDRIEPDVVDFSHTAAAASNLSRFGKNFIFVGSNYVQSYLGAVS